MIEVGNEVVVISKKCRGHVKFIGGLEGLKGIFYGVELISDKGNNDGCFKSKVVFICKKNYGVFVRRKNLTKNKKKTLKETDFTKENLDVNANVGIACVNATHLPILCSVKIPDLDKIVYGSCDHFIYSMGISTMKLTKPNFKSKIGHKDWVTSISYLPKNRNVISAAMDGTVCVWTENLIPKFCEKIHNGSISKLSRLTSKKAVASSYDSTLSLLNFHDKSISVDKIFKGHGGSVLDFLFDESYSELLSISRKGEFMAWDLKNAKCKFKFCALGGQGTALAVDDKLSFVGDEKGCLRIFDQRSQQPTFQYQAHSIGAAVTDVIAYSDAGQEVFTTGADKVCKVWSLRNGFKEPIKEVFFTDFPYVSAKEEEYFFIGDGKGILTTFSLSSAPSLKRTKVFEAAPRCFNFYKNKLILAGDNGDVKCLNLEELII